MGSRRREPGTLTIAGDAAQSRVSSTSATIDPVALYVHFPLCLSICPYCDFVVYGGRAARGPENRIDQLVEALVAEIGLRGRAARLGSIYLGGGTPSLMTPAHVARLLDAADTSFGVAAGAEITLEVNPGPADRGDIAGFAAAGINRLSVGAQSMSSAELHSLGRRHSPADVAQTVSLGRSAGIRSLSLDVLYDVPGQTLASWRASLDGVLALEPDHISAYALTLDAHEPGDDQLVPSRGAVQWRARARPEQDEDRAAGMYELADDRLARAGLRWYEISNWSRAGHESRHNGAYWSGAAWQAVGPGAHAFDGVGTRRWNDAHLGRYVSALGSGRLPPGGSVTSAAALAGAELAVLKLRTSAGLPEAEAHDSAFQRAVAWGIETGLLESNERGVRLTRRGRLLSNELFSRLLPDPNGAA